MTLNPVFKYRLEKSYHSSGVPINTGHFMSLSDVIENIRRDNLMTGYVVYELRPRARVEATEIARGGDMVYPVTMTLEGDDK